MADRPGRSSARRRNNGRGEQRGTLVDSLPRTPAAPRTPLRADRRDAYQENWEAEQSYPAYARWNDDDAEAGDYRGYDEDNGYDAGDAEAYDAYDEDEAYPPYADDRDDWNAPRSREHSQARPLTPAMTQQFRAPVSAPFAPAAAPVTAYVSAPMPVAPRISTDHTPAIAAFRPAAARARVRLNTQRLVETARNPWTIARMVLALTALLLGVFHAAGQMGENSQPMMVAQASAGLAPGSAITTLVRPETQLLRPDLYDNTAQFNDWGGAACSAAAISEILTAYGVPNATIGHEIDELGSYISPNGGLLSRHGFVVVAAKHNLRADESTSLSYNQLVYITEQLGMPVIVNVRISYGYYHFFDGGHFLTVVGGDAQGLRIVDSSEYYIHYLPKDVFYQMFTGYTAAIVPASYQYTLPTS